MTQSLGNNSPEAVSECTMGRQASVIMAQCSISLSGLITTVHHTFISLEKLDRPARDF